jgi:urease accessory protein UreF
VTLKELKQRKEEHQSEKVSVDVISLLQLSDCLFPTGMYTMSNGLETYFYDKKIRNANQVQDLFDTTSWS